MRILLILFLLFPINAFAASKAENGRDMAAIEAYLNGLTTVVADFLQTDGEGKVSGGKFFLKRPGKLRWQYDPPVPILIISSNGIISYQDLELNQVSRTEADQSLAAFLCKPIISFNSKDVNVTAFSNKAGSTRVTLERPGHSEEGSLTMVFSSNPIALKKMEVLDSTGKVTNISFHNIQQGIKLPDKLFFIDEISRMDRKK